MEEGKERSCLRRKTTSSKETRECMCVLMTRLRRIRKCEEELLHLLRGGGMEEGCAVVVSLISPANFLWVSLWWRYAAAPLQSVVVAPLGKVQRTHTHTHTHTHIRAPHHTHPRVMDLHRGTASSVSQDSRRGIFRITLSSVSA